MSEAAPAIVLRDVSYAYNGHAALRRVNLTVPEGEFLTVIGPNGGGKTTLLRLLLGLLRPTTGQVLVFGREPSDVSDRLGYMPQTQVLGRDFPITVLETVLLGRLGARSFWPFWSRSERERALRCLERTGVAHLEKARLCELSGGQRQRVFLARALACEPRMLLLDEPTASVDPEGRATLHELLGSLAKDITIVLVSHDVSVISRYVTAVACVNQTVHFHPRPELTPEMFAVMYHGGQCGCPVELIAQSLPPRILNLKKDAP
ncbi:ABC transporter ATP-binding protein [Fundidesulfovibrio butyratiphilus]